MNEITWKYDEIALNQKGLSLDIIDKEEILEFTRIETENSLVLEDKEFMNKVANKIYDNVKKGLSKGSIQFKITYLLID